jgi:uncharacterized membrane protein
VQVRVLAQVRVLVLAQVRVLVLAQVRVRVLAQVRVLGLLQALAPVRSKSGAASTPMYRAVRIQLAAELALLLKMAQTTRELHLPCAMPDRNLD